MAKDRIVIRMLFSGALIVFGIIHLLYTIFSRFRKGSRFKKDLSDIKNNGMDNIIHESLEKTELTINEATKREFDNLLKEVYFNLYNKHQNKDEIEE